MTFLFLTFRVTSEISKKNYEEYVYKTLSRCLEKTAEFCRFECHFIYGDIGISPIFKFCPTWDVQVSVLRSFSACLTKVLPNPLPPKPNNLYLTFLPRDFG